MSGNRPAKVGDLLKEEISTIILREMKDPRLGFSTVTGVRVSGDLKSARVFISVMGSAQQKTDELEALNHASHFIQGLLRTRVSLKYIPTLKFVLDETLDYAENIEHLIDRLKKPEAENTD
jgi:ribosome-binding factor A